MTVNKTLFLAAPPETYAPEKDTTRVLMEAAERRGVEVWTATHLDLAQDGARVFVRGRKLTFPGESRWFRAGEPEPLDLHEFCCVWFRHDPPFDDIYLHATQLVDAVPDLVAINAPRGLRDANEKLFALQFADLMPETLVSKQPDDILTFMERVGGRCVVKPIDGFGGTGIFTIQADDPNLTGILQTVTSETWTMAQAYIPDVDAGDMRVLLMDGEVIGQFLRVPRAGEFRGNMMQGGRVEACDLTAAARRIVDRVAPVLAEHGLRLVGLDVVGGYLTEINVTSPTGFQEVRKLMGHDPAEAVWDAVLQGFSS